MARAIILVASFGLVAKPTSGGIYGASALNLRPPPDVSKGT